MKKWMSLLAVAALAYSPISADVVIDDFENGLEGTDGQTALGEQFNYYVSADDKNYDAGYWYGYDDEKDGGSSKSSPDYIADKEFEGGLAGGSDGQYLALDITLGTGTDEWETAFYGFGCNLTVEGNMTDLSSMTGVEFDAMGSGTMNLKFVTEKSSEYSWGDMVAAFKLASSWEKVSISTSDIAPEPWSPTADDGVKWDDCKSAVTKLHFQTNGDKHKAGASVSFNVDNIVLKGVSPTDFEWDGNTIQNDYPSDLKTTSVADVKVVADEVKLGDAYPNPFNPVTTINFNLPTAEKVSLKVFDAAGNLVNTLFNGVTAGTSVNWNATNVNGSKVASGVYFYRLTSGSKVMTKKMVLLK